MPVRALIDSIIDSNTIGKVTTISANLGYTISTKPRVERPELGGGVMLDISVYPINFALMATKDSRIIQQSGICVKNAYGADIKETMNMVDENGVMISLFADGTTLSDRRGIIYGTDGRIEVDNVNNPSKVEVFTFNGREVNKKEEHILSHHSTGFEYELRRELTYVSLITRDGGKIWLFSTLSPRINESSASAEARESALSLESMLLSFGLESSA